MKTINKNQLIPAYSFLQSSNIKNTAGEKHFMINNVNALESERIKIGHELHDSVNPLLAVAKLYMSLITTQTEKEAHAKKEAITSILEAIENIRNISAGLVISQNEDFDLLKIVAKLVNRINGTSLFNIHLKVSAEKEIGNLSCTHKLTLYRIVQEQLNNIIKYSQASLVKIYFTCINGIIKLLIKDDGVGFDTTKQKNGIGLSNIEKRIKDFDGFFKITSFPGKGCCLQVSFKKL